MQTLAIFVLAVAALGAAATDGGYMEATVFGMLSINNTQRGLKTFPSL